MEFDGVKKNGEENALCVVQTPSEEKVERRTLERELKSTRSTLCCLMIACIVMILLFNQFVSKQQKLAATENEYSYAVTVLIDLQEDQLFLKYQLIPSQIEGLGELEDAWHDNPCRDTATAYSDALRSVLDFLNNGGDVDEPDRKENGIVNLHYV